MISLSLMIRNTGAAQPDLEITDIEVLSNTPSAIKYCVAIKNVGDQTSLINNNNLCCLHGVTLLASLSVNADGSTHEDDQIISTSALKCEPGNMSILSA